MTKDAEMRRRIIDSSRELFFRHGFSKVTTDEIAEAAGISKRTLYQYFESKGSLFLKVIEDALEEAVKKAEEIMADGDLDFPEKLNRLMQLRSGELARIGDPLVEDVRRKFPDLWNAVRDMRRSLFRSHLRRLIDEGVRAGFFLKDLDPLILEAAYAAAVAEVVNPDSLADLPYTAAQATEAVTRLIFFGALTDKARISLKGAGAGRGDAARGAGPAGARLKKGR